MNATWNSWVDSELEAVRAAGRWREHRTLDGDGVNHRLDDGRDVVSFASNDYLGLTQHAAVIDAASVALRRWGAGSGSARLIVGSRPIHADLERELADWKGEDAALVFPTGFAANLGVVSTFGATDTIVFSDELNHASIIDGCRLSRAEVHVDPHGDLDALADQLDLRKDRRAIVVTDTVFSMDGDVADVDQLARLCARHDALLVLDEAHAVLGPHPEPAVLGRCAHLRVGTLSKTLGALGGFVAGSRDVIDLLVNRARPAIFTTALSPADTAAAHAALGVLRSNEGVALLDRLRRSIDRLLPDHPSPIVPIVVGDERQAIAAAEALLHRGLLVPAIRPPTVAPGSSRLRVTLSAAHADDHIDRLVDALHDLGLRP